MVMKDILETFSVIHRLNSVERFSRDHCMRRENVLEHIGFCTVFAFWMVETLPKSKLDAGKLFRRLAAHDMDEAVLGDIPRITKYWSEQIRQSFEKAEREAIDSLSLKLSMQSLPAIWREAKTADLEGDALKVIDLAAVVYKVWQEVQLNGNRAFIAVAHELDGFLEQFAVKVGADFWPIMQNLKAVNNASATLTDPLTYRSV